MTDGETFSLVPSASGGACAAAAARVIMTAAGLICTLLPSVIEGDIGGGLYTGMLLLAARARCIMITVGLTGSCCTEAAGALAVGAGDANGCRRLLPDGGTYSLLPACGRAPRLNEYLAYHYAFKMLAARLPSGSALQAQACAHAARALELEHAQPRLPPAPPLPEYVALLEENPPRPKPAAAVK
jgi:hypothetical protein